MKRSIPIIIILLTLISANVSAGNDVSEYQYKKTRDHVAYVHQAADLLEEKGEKAFEEFREKGSKWFNQDRYLFVYDLTGKNIFHPANPELEGQDLIDLKDIDGKPLIRFLVDAVNRDESGSGWVHYSWIEHGDIFPLRKSSYVIKVTTPSKKEYLIGSGLYNMRLEKKFIVDIIDRAVSLTEENGTKAFDVFRDKSQPYDFHDIYIFVIKDDGTAVVDPAFPTMEGRNLLDLKDAVGKYIFRDLIKKLQNRDAVWLDFMWPKEGEWRPSRNVMYARKVRIGDTCYIVGSSIPLADPIWLRM